LTGTEVAGSIVIAFLTFMLLHMLRPYVSKRSEESGKIDALAASIEIVKENTAQLTAVTKKIEADISDRVWDRQARWNFRRDNYVRVLELVGEKISLNSKLEFHTRSNLPVDEEMRRFNDQLNAELGRVIGVCQVALSSDANMAIQEYLTASSTLRGSTLEYFQTIGVHLARLRNKLVDAAKRDLSYERFQDGS
jgi:hypothetical protein